VLGLLALAVSAVTCPGGPVFVFQPGTAKLTDEANRFLPDYIENLNSELWSNGWITVGLTVLDRDDRQARHLMRRRARAIQRCMANLGIARARVRFEKVNHDYYADSDDWTDVYPSTLSVPEAVWNRLVPPNLMC